LGYKGSRLSTEFRAFPAAIAVHVVAALATIAGFIIHVYMGTAMVRGSFGAIITGTVSASWTRHHPRVRTGDEKK
jgi:cytochrome b subunit of formate dehydrogenase